MSEYNLALAARTSSSKITFTLACGSHRTACETDSAQTSVVAERMNLLTNLSR